MELISELEAFDEALVSLRLSQSPLLGLRVPEVALDPLLADFIGSSLGNDEEGAHLQRRTKFKHLPDFHEALMNGFSGLGMW